MNIYVGNLPREASEDDLRKAFEAFGEVSSVKIITDKFTGDPRGFGFVEMSNSSEAQAAISGLDGKDLKGSRTFITIAKFCIRAYLRVAWLDCLPPQIHKHTYLSSQEKGKFCLKDT